jgi:hypothetical protein
VRVEEVIRLQGDRGIRVDRLEVEIPDIVTRSLVSLTCGIGGGTDVR